MAKRVDPLKAKEKKQKIVAAVGAVLLLGILAFEGPKVWKQLHKKPIAAGPAVTTTAATSTTPGTAPSLAAPSLAGGQQPATSTATPAGSLASGETAPTADQGQLASFSRFASKDPFVQQLGGAPPSSSGSKTSSGGTTGGGSASTGGSTGVGSQPAPGSAVISVNGTLMTVTVGTDFPQPSTATPGVQPFFHLRSLTAHTATITIAGGSYSNGAATVTLRENKPVTLVNTADGTRFKLILKPQGTPVPAASGPSSGSTTTTSTTTTTPGP